MVVSQTELLVILVFGIISKQVSWTNIRYNKKESRFISTLFLFLLIHYLIELIDFIKEENIYVKGR